MKNRIVGYGEEAADQLLANPANWKIHPRYQQEALTDALGEIGWLRPVIVNRVTGNLLDGHLRVMLALKHGHTSVPVTYVELTEAEEKRILATIDPIAGMAETSAARLEQLLGKLQERSDLLGDLLAGLAERAEAGLTPSSIKKSKRSKSAHEVRLRIGAFILKVPRSQYARWLQALQADAAAHPGGVAAVVKARLGMLNEVA